MTYLFLDTSSNTLILSLIQNNTIIETSILETNREHSIYAVEKLNALLNNHKLDPVDIDKLFVVTGPGSFTGVRIGVTIAKTYGYALKKEVIPVSSLKMKILEYSGYDYYVITVEDKNNMVFCGIYDRGYTTLFEGLIDLADLNQKLSTMKHYKLIQNERDDLNRKNLDIISVVRYYDKQLGVNPHELKPNYLKEVI